MILEQVTSISNPPEVMLNRKVIKKCHSTIAIDRTFTIALPEWNGSSLLSPCAFKNKPIQSYRSLTYECFWHKRC